MEDPLNSMRVTVLILCRGGSHPSVALNHSTHAFVGGVDRRYPTTLCRVSGGFNLRVPFPSQNVLIGYICQV